jgi:hypothetical protein
MPPAAPAPTDIKAVATTVSAVDLPIKDYYTYGTTLAVKKLRRLVQHVNS